MGKKKERPQGPNNAYLMSFGDTMTTLLAFFIVLNSLAEEQTGANLYRGTGSFVRAMDNFGLPGSMPGDGSANAIPRGKISPLYVVPDPEGRPSENNPSGPDEEDNGIRVIDREEEDFQRLINEFDRLAQVAQLPSTEGEAVFDFFEPLNPKPPVLSKKLLDALAPVIPRLHEANFRVELIVWATTPSPTAMKRAIEQSQLAESELASLGRLPPASRARLSASARPWFDPKEKRPVISAVIRRVGQ